MVIQKIISRRFAIALLSLLCAFGMGKVAADTVLQAVVQSYSSSASLQRGMIVKLVQNNGNKVEPATLETVEKMTGVVVSPSDAAVTLSSPTSSGQVYVATSGRYQVLVSSQNGTINAGDYVTVSSLDGVGMRADSSQQEVLGKAVGSFDGAHNVKSSTTIKNTSGKTVDVKIGLIPVDISIAPNPIALKVSNIPGFLQRASLLVSNKPVSPWRTYVGLIILLGSLLVSGSLLYGGVRNGMVAIGRNPLAKQSIMGNLVQVVITSIIIFVIGLFAVYLLLRL
jgi:hypothetical protein